MIFWELFAIAILFKYLSFVNKYLSLYGATSDVEFCESGQLVQLSRETRHRFHPRWVSLRCINSSRFLLGRINMQLPPCSERCIVLPDMSIWPRVWKVSKRVAFALVCVLIVAMVAGAIYQFVATRLDAREYPLPGQMVDIGGHRLHLNCTGQGSPTVILEAGLGGGSLDWDLVQPGVAGFTRVCSYDRSGVAWSERGAAKADALQVIDELHRLLSAANITPPYVFAGHSLGGIYAQLYAAKYPDEVVGMVLVDSSSQDQLDRMGGIPGFLPYILKGAAPVGLTRIIGKRFIKPPPELSTEANSRRTALYLMSKHVYAVADEMENIAADMDELRSSPMDLGNRPLIVLVHGLIDPSALETEAIWSELQNGLAKRSSNSQLIIAKQSGHYIQFSEPKLVVDSIRRVVEQGAGHLRAEN